jgi:hypothetical protein
MNEMSNGSAESSFGAFSVGSALEAQTGSELAALNCGGCNMCSNCSEGSCSEEEEEEEEGEVDP